MDTALPRPTKLRPSPLAWVAIAAAASVVVRLAVALQVRAPVFYPDEYLSTDIARGIAEGNLGAVRGGSLTTTYTSYFVPLVQAPFWLLENIGLSVRLSQALGAIAFAAAAFPAYALGRRLGITERGSLVVAVLALVVPAGAFTATLLAEPYAYPLFLVTVLVGIEAIAKPTPMRHLAMFAAFLGLCFVGGLQFLYVGPAYVAAWVLSAWPSTGTLVRRLALLLGGSAALLALVLGSGRGSYLELLLGAVRSQTYSLVSVSSWVVANAFVLAVAAGWVLVPGAVLGLHALRRERDSRLRAFALLTVLLLAGMVFEAALWGANGFGIYERFTFYGAPLLALAFVWAVEQAKLRKPAYAAVAYLGAFAAIVLPLTEPLFAAIDHQSPSINGLSELTLGAEFGGGIWAPALALLAIGTAWRGFHNPRAVLVVAAIVCTFATVGQSFVFMRVTENRKVPPHVRAPAGSAMLTWRGASPFLLLDTLFWNPNITRVVLVGGGVAPDGLPFIRAQFASAGHLVAKGGSPIRGPFVIAPDVVVGGLGGPTRDLPPLATLSEVPPLLAFGFRRETGDVGSSGRVYATATDEPRRLLMRLRSPKGVKTIGVKCAYAFDRRFSVGTEPTSIVVPVPARTTEFCIVYLIRGGIDRIDGRHVSVEATLALEPDPSPPSESQGVGA
jgi:hypothetical protein